MKCQVLTYKRDHQDAKKDPKRIAENVHEHNGDQGDSQITFTLSSLVLFPTEDLKS